MKCNNVNIIIIQSFYNYPEFNMYLITQVPFLWVKSSVYLSILKTSKLKKIGMSEIGMSRSDLG